MIVGHSTAAVFPLLLFLTVSMRRSVAMRVCDRLPLSGGKESEADALSDPKSANNLLLSAIVQSGEN